ncbi:MAG: O-antigen ligase family protein [Patescibacteria group bacterium]|jgi:O-antigen ligase
MHKFSKEFVFTAIAILAISLFTVVSIFWSFNLLLYVFCFAIAGLAILKFPQVGVYAIIFCTMVFERWFTLQSLVWADQAIKFYPLDLIIVFTVISLFLHWKVGQRFVFAGKGLRWALWLWLAVITGSFIRSFSEVSADFSSSFSTFKNFAVYFVVYLLLVNIIKNKEQFDRMIKVMISAGVILVYFIVYGLVSGQGIWVEYVPLSTPGTRLLGGPHSFYLTALIIILINILAFRSKWTKTEYFYLTLLGVFFVGLLASLQRHLWLALILGLAITFFYYQAEQRKKFFQMIGFGLLVLLFVALLSFWLYSWQTTNFLTDAELTHSLQFRLFSFFTAESQDSSAMWRLASWQSAWQVFSANPLWGIGFGKRLNFDISGLEYNIEMRDLHNDFVGMAVQMGFFGILIILSLFYGLWRFFKNHYRKMLPEYKGHLLTFFTLAIMFLWSANFGIYFDINMLVVFFWVFLGSMVAVSRVGGK